MSLSSAEENLMQHLWKVGSGYLNDLYEQYPNPKPAKTTIATLLKRMIEKGYVDYEKRGRSREYYPLVSKTDYFLKRFNKLIKAFFNDSTTQFASFFTSETNLSKSELEELKEIIEEEIQKKKS